MKHSLSLFAATIAAATLAACAQTRQPIDPPVAEKAQLTLRATGVQVYQCRAGDKGAEWAFVGPEATLYDTRGQRAGRHYGGPTWEAIDGSRVTATVAARLPAASPDTIPQLLLTARPATPKGAFSQVSSIQRVDTVGGAAPAAPCTAATAGATERVTYSANYVFFVR